MDNNEIKKIIEIKKQKRSFRIFWENFVFEHEGYFYKIPNIVAKTIFYNWKNSFEEVKKSYNLIKKYFWKDFLIPETKIIEYKPWSYLIKQKKIPQEFLTKKLLKENIILQEKFKKLMYINEQMWEKEGYFLDITWTDFIYKSNTLHNLMVFQKEICIFDFWLLNKNDKSKIFRFVSKVSYEIQKRIINTFFVKYKDSYKNFCELNNNSLKKHCKN